MFISVNGPDLENFDFNEPLKLWKKRNRHIALLQTLRLFNSYFVINFVFKFHNKFFHVLTGML